MCGRYTVTRPVKEVANRFNLDLDERLSFTSPITFNAAPTQLLPVVSSENPNELSFYRWGLIPHWATDLAISNKLINARAETLEEKTTFKHLIGARRCLVLADGYYEWKKGKEKLPYRVTRTDQELFAFAGLWDTWVDKSTGEEVRSFTIITSDAAPELKILHPRMPVVLEKEDEQRWLDPKLTVREAIQILQGTHPAMTSYPVSKAVGSPSENSPELIAPCPIETTGSLFD